MPKAKTLMAGFRAFRATYFDQRPDLFESLNRDGQRPKMLIIACSDSRVDPAILFNAEPGEFFVVRNVANLVPPYQPDGHYHGTSAAIEFAVRDLGVEEILVLGHSACGGIHALCETAKGRSLGREFLTAWISMARAAYDAVRKEQGPESDDLDHSLVEQAAIAQSVTNLRSFPWIQEKEAAGELVLRGWWFDMAAGAIWAMNPKTRTFEKIEPGA